MKVYELIHILKNKPACADIKFQVVVNKEELRNSLEEADNEGWESNSFDRTISEMLVDENEDEIIFETESV